MCSSDLAEKNLVLDKRQEEAIRAEARKQAKLLCEESEREIAEAHKEMKMEAERHFLQEAKTGGLELTHNKEVGRYRIDFSVVEDGQPTHCNISILGEKWHKNKLPHDFARMRDLTKAGELMIPFTARQVFADPSKCVSEVKSIFSKWRQSLASA